MTQFRKGLLVGFLWALSLVATYSLADDDLSLPGKIQCLFQFGGFDCPASATTGGSLALKEPTAFGSNTFIIKVPDTGLSANNTIVVTADGKLVKEAFALTGANDSCTSGFKYACVPN